MQIFLAPNGNKLGIAMTAAKGRITLTIREQMQRSGASVVIKHRRDAELFLQAFAGAMQDAEWLELDDPPAGSAEPGDRNGGTQGGAEGGGNGGPNGR